MGTSVSPTRNVLSIGFMADMDYIILYIFLSNYDNYGIMAIWNDSRTAAVSGFPAMAGTLRPIPEKKKDGCRGM